MRRQVYRFTSVLALVLTVFVLASCSVGSTRGIPHGLYSRLDDQGKKINDGAEGAWIIRWGVAEHRYLEFSIVKIDGIIYFEILRSQEGSPPDAESGLFRYAANYNRRTRLLTVSMPSYKGDPYHIPTTAYEHEEFQFRNTGITIW